jgi:hypothetical protein
MTTLLERDQRRALVRTFLARFFENEITAGTDDLKASFIWLLSFLSVPGFFMPVMMGFSYAIFAMLHGPEALRIASRGDKAFYLGFAMTASAAITAVTWSSLLVDRRDGLILGALPVRPATVVRAKLTALAAYVGLVAGAMNLPAAISFGSALSARSSAVAGLWMIVVQYVTSVAAFVFVFVAVAAAQGTLLAGLGPRLFARASPLLQVLLVASVVGSLVALPVINVSVVDTLRGTGRNVHPWLLALPPLWFLGLYEWGLGTSDPVLLRLAALSVAGLASASLLTVVTYPLAYRRVMRSAVDGSSGGRVGTGARTVDALTACLVRAGAARAVVQFFSASLGRVERLRFVMAVSAGVALTWIVPTWFALLRNPPAGPQIGALSLPLSTMLFVLAAVRVAASLPADGKAAWMFEVTPPSKGDVRTALERTLLAFVVVPSVVVFTPLYWALWGPAVAITHAAIALAIGALIIAGLFSRLESMPCSRPWDPENLNLGRRWFVYLAVFIIITSKVPEVELLLFGKPVATALLLALLLVTTWLVRRAGSRHVDPPPDDPAALAVGNILSLD